MFWPDKPQLNDYLVPLLLAQEYGFLAYLPSDPFISACSHFARTRPPRKTVKNGLHIPIATIQAWKRLEDDSEFIIGVLNFKALATSSYTSQNPPSSVSLARYANHLSSESTPSTVTNSGHVVRYRLCASTLIFDQEDLPIPHVYLSSPTRCEQHGPYLCVHWKGGVCRDTANVSSHPSPKTGAKILRAPSLRRRFLCSPQNARHLQSHTPSPTVIHTQ